MKIGVLYFNGIMIMKDREKRILSLKMKRKNGFFLPPRKDCWKQQNFGSCIYPLEGVLTPNPILKVLSTFKTCEVKCLLIGEYWKPLRKELEMLRHDK